MTESGASDPGSERAGARAAAVAAPSTPIRLGETLVRIGTAGWTDPTLIGAGTFYPAAAKSAEDRLRFYATQFPLVEVDSTYYALPPRRSAELWVERTPPDFIFDVKAFALITGHPTEVSRLPKDLRDTLPASLAATRRLSTEDVPEDFKEEVIRRFRDALEPLHSAGKLGAVLLQFPPWLEATRPGADAIIAARDAMSPFDVAVELRHSSWFAGRVAERTLELLRDAAIPFVMVDEPQGTDHSVPPINAVTAGRATLRLHGRRPGFWDRRGASVADRFRYLYSAPELEEIAARVRDAATRARELHVIFNNCYANYATTNARELMVILGGTTERRNGGAT